MTISNIILSHFLQRESNLKRIVDDLLAGTVKPEKIIIFIDNPGITYRDDRVTIIRSSTSFLPIIRFGLGAIADTDYCFFLDDDLSVKPKTLENFLKYADGYNILGLEGSILGDTDTPYSNDTPIRKAKVLTRVDILIRNYFVATELISYGLQLRSFYPDLPKKSLDDVFLCLGNKYLNNESCYVIPADEESDLIELSDGGVGQSYTEDHYKNRNIVCKFLKEKYE